MHTIATRPGGVRHSRPARLRLALEPLEPRVLLSVTVLSETFEGAFPAANGWTVGDSNPAGTPAYWNAKASTFGGELPHGGDWKGYCAGTGYGGDDSNPTYQNDMTAYMSRDIDLTNYVAATLTYWHKMPSIEAPGDVGRVYIDSTVVGSRSLTLGEWTLQTVDLDVFLGGTHTLKFEFTSNSSTTAEGWYLDDILVTGETDPDDTISTATSLGAVGASPTSVTGQSISAGIDVDMYSFTVTAGQRVAFDVDKPASGALYDPFLRLFNDSGGALMASDNQVGPAPETDNLEPYFEYTFATPGTYYVAVSGQTNQGYNPLTGADDIADGVGAYDLILTTLGPDPAGTIGLATNLGAIGAGGSATFTDSVNPARDVDMFSFTVVAGQRLGFDTDMKSVWAPDTYLRLFDAAGTELAANDNAVGPSPEGGLGESYIEYTFNTAGTYYLGVSGFPNTAYDPLTGGGVAAGDVGWYDLTVRDLGRYVGRIPSAGAAYVDVYDCDLTNDIVLGDVTVVFGTGNAVSSITLVGATHKTGLGIAVSGASSVGKVSDKRSLPGDMAFFLSGAPVASLSLLSNVNGFNINGLTVSNIGFGPDLDSDGDQTDRTALFVQGALPKLSITGNLDGDAIIQRDLSSLAIKGSIAGDVRVSGDVPKASVSGNWAGAITARSLGSPKITGTLSGSIATYGTDAKGLSIGKLSAGQIGNLVVTATSAISGISAGSWANGSLSATWVSSFAITGNCGADLTLSGVGALKGTLAKASVGGTLQDAMWKVTGVLSSLTVGRWGAGSILAVGVNPGGDGTYFTGDDSAIAGSSVSKATITSYDTVWGHDFGLLAGLFLSGKLAGVTPVLPFTNGQFRIVRVA